MFWSTHCTTNFEDMQGRGGGVCLQTSEKPWIYGPEITTPQPDKQNYKTEVFFCCAQQSVIFANYNRVRETYF